MTAVQNQLRLPASYFSTNRDRLLDQLGDPALALLTSGRPPHRTADEDYPFWTDRNYFYLSGLEQEDCVLLLLRAKGQTRQILFIPEQDPMFERWRGHRAGPDEATACSGIDEIQYASCFKGLMADILSDKNIRLWLDTSAKDSQSSELKSWLTEAFPDQLALGRDLEPFLTQLRMIKCPVEIDHMQKAIALTGTGIRAMLRRMEPGLMEYQLWAEFAGVLAEAGCLSPAFPSIVASGKNLFCLHYMKPFSQIEDGDLVQIDVGAITGSLCADISRVIPANGRFSERQKELYQIVRQCQETAFAVIRPGTTLAAINEACRKTAYQGLTAAGMMKPGEAITDYFWHNVSHHLGLDVHDVANRETTLQPGMVLTVEPGIYIPTINIGMRIEDDVLVTEEGCRNLSQAIPREYAEIEAIMSGIIVPA
ncbi:MAG: aminopeptidase P N-terminal domain-containing protein [Bacillota bacterium]|nr:aminopeptidase P N-terminal domain-containing protein [Bacillota bacterium]